MNVVDTGRLTSSGWQLFQESVRRPLEVWPESWKPLIVCNHDYLEPEYNGADGMSIMNDIMGGRVRDDSSFFIETSALGGLFYILNDLFQGLLRFFVRWLPVLFGLFVYGLLVFLAFLINRGHRFFHTLVGLLKAFFRRLFLISTNNERSGHKKRYERDTK